MAGVEFDAALTLLVLAATLAGMVREHLAPDILMLGAVGALTAAGVIDVEAALSGFANPTLPALGALFVVVAPALLGERQDIRSRQEAQREKRVEMELGDVSPLVRRSAEEAGLDRIPGLPLVGISRRSGREHHVELRDELSAGDRVTFEGELEEALRSGSELGLTLVPTERRSATGGRRPSTPATRSSWRRSPASPGRSRARGTSTWWTSSPGSVRWASSPPPSWRRCSSR